MKVTPRTIIQSPCRLRLIDVSQVLRFAITHQEAHFIHTGTPHIPDLVPGSLTPSDQQSGDVYVKNHTFRVRLVSSQASEMLRVLATSHLIAIYQDERGHDRVSGTVSHPLSLSYTISGGSFVCTLRGTTLYPDTFLSV